jgi:hypothetical protein
MVNCASAVYRLGGNYARRRVRVLFFAAICPRRGNGKAGRGLVVVLGRRPRSLSHLIPRHEGVAEKEKEQQSCDYTEEEPSEAGERPSSHIITRHLRRFILVLVHAAITRVIEA